MSLEAPRRLRHNCNSLGKRASPCQKAGRRRRRTAAESAARRDAGKPSRRRTRPRGSSRSRWHG